MPFPPDGTMTIRRVNKYTGYMLYAEMAMYQNDETRYSKALTFMNEIIGDAGYSLLPDFADCGSRRTNGTAKPSST